MNDDEDLDMLLWKETGLYTARADDHVTVFHAVILQSSLYVVIIVHFWIVDIHSFHISYLIKRSSYLLLL